MLEFNGFSELKIWIRLRLRGQILGLYVFQTLKAVDGHGAHTPDDDKATERTVQDRQDSPCGKHDHCDDAGNLRHVGILRPNQQPHRCWDNSESEYFKNP